MNEILVFDQMQAELLICYLSAPERPSGTMRYEEVAGFLFAITCIPEEIAPWEWMPVVFNENAPEPESHEFAPCLSALISLYKHTLDDIVEGVFSFPIRFAILPDAADNFMPDAPLSLWARGFWEGYQWIEHSWPEVIPDSADDELSTVLVILTFFSSREAANDYVKEMDSEGESLDIMAQKMLPLIPDAMRRYAELAEAFAGTEEEMVQEPVAVEKIGRNDPCPCGSGMKYKKCCGRGSP